MKNRICITNWTLLCAVLLFVVHQTISSKIFNCAAKAKQEGEKVVPLPDFPDDFSTNIRINFEKVLTTTEMKHAVRDDYRKELIEFKTKDRHVKYIVRRDEKCTLVITYDKDENPTCSVKETVDLDKFLEEADSGPSRIISVIHNAITTKQEEFISYGTDAENGMLIKKWEKCFSDPALNISMSFSLGQGWSHPYFSTSTDENKKVYPERIEAEINGVALTALYSSFNPRVPDDALFQPPEHVYCKGFRTDKKPPTFLNFFSYYAEVIVYIESLGIEPIVSARRVFYDYVDQITRIDFYDPLAETPDLVSSVVAKVKSYIVDHNAGIEYYIDPFTGNCFQGEINFNFNAIQLKFSEKGEFYNGNEFFLLNSDLSYNGQFPVRGMMADVYTYRKIDPENKNATVISWYFATEENRIVETDKSEKRVLLRMSVRPETGGLILMNFYNFANEKPDPFRYDLRSCYNESVSKVLVLTFPVDDRLRGSEKITGFVVHSAIKTVTGISKQRLYINEVRLDKKYMYAEFDILEAPVPLGKTEKPKQVSLDEAIEKLKKAISEDKFSVNVPVGNVTIALKPEPNGLNVFAGDRTPAPTTVGYKEGGVIALTIGMLVLGFALGGMTLNLVINKKFGVSLFQRKKYENSYSDPESSL